MNKINFNKDNLTYFNIDYILFTLLLIVCIFDLFILYSATNQSLVYVENQFYRILFGFFILIILSKTPSQYIRFITPYLFIFTILFLILVILIGIEKNGATRWLDIYFLQFQPSEIAKITLPMFLALFIQDNPIIKNYKNLFFSTLLLLLTTFLILIEPDLGTSILIFMSGFVVLFVAGFPFQIIFYSIITFLISLPIFWFYILKEYQRDRIFTLFNPEHDPLGNGYHIIQSKIAIGSGGFWGQGWLNGKQTQLSFVPEQHTDFIYSVIGEEFGFFGFLLLLTIYGLIIYRTIKLIKKMDILFYKLTSIAFVSSFAFYIFVNIGMVSGILPVVGLPLPFISYGGSSLLILFIMFGIISSFYNNTIKK